MRKALAALAATGALGLAAPAMAAATTFCVGKDAGGGFSGCTGTKESTISAAISAAHTSGDTIDIGPGTYDEKPLVPATKTLTIAGAGAGQTVVQPSGTANSAGATFNVLTSGTHVSGLTIGLENGDSNFGIQTAGAFTNIAITAPSTATHPSGAYFLLGSPSLTDSSITLGADSQGILSTASAGVVSAVRITARDGISFSPPSTRSFTVDDVLFVMTPGTLPGVAVSAVANDFGTSPTLTATIRQLTAYGDGSTNSTGVRASAISTSAGSVANVSIASSIIRNVHHAIVSDAETICPCHATSTVAVDYSDLDTGSDATTTTGASGTPSANINVGAHNINADPLFVTNPPSAGADPSAYHLSAGSPAIDAGDPAPLAAGEPTTDLDGSPRVQVGRQGDSATTDMGALEFTPHAPVASASASPARAGLGSPVSFSATGSSTSDPGDRLSYSWRFDDGQTATGPTVSHGFATAGSHSGTVTVMDLDGLTATATARVTVTSSGPGRDSSLRVKPRVLTKRGAIVSYIDSLAETTRFTVQRPVAGVRRGHKCVKPGGGAIAGEGHKRCTLWISVGSFKRSDTAGKNHFRFSGRVKHHRLAAGKYRLEAQTTLDGVRGGRAYRSFTVR